MDCGHAAGPRRTTSQYRSLIWLVLKFRYRSILKLFRAELTAYGVRGNTNGPILAAIMAALSFHLAAAMAVAGMRACPAQVRLIDEAEPLHAFLNAPLHSHSSPQPGLAAHTDRSLSKPAIIIAA